VIWNMKKIIKGKIYNTEKAEVISQWKGHDETITIYRTEKGNFFRHIVYKPVEALHEMTENEVLEWLAKHDLEKTLELFSHKLEEA